MKTSLIKEVKARIQRHRKIVPDSFRLRLFCPEIARLAQPGQFMMLRVSDRSDPFLRRPFSFSRISPPGEKAGRFGEEGTVEIYYRVVGRGTSLMTQFREGQRVDVLGPLGNGFRMVEGRQRAILIGGGIGVAPLMAWAEKIRKSQGKPLKNLGKASEVQVLIGGKTRENILGIKEFRKMKLEPRVSTEDGSLGMKGLATDLLERELLTEGHSSVALYACGPMPMLAGVAQISEQFDLPCQVLVESRMACGIGACLGCAVRVRGAGSEKIVKAEEWTAGPENPLSAGEWREGERALAEGNLMPVIAEAPSFRYVRACKEGPVFEAREIMWE